MLTPVAWLVCLAFYMGQNWNFPALTIDGAFPLSLPIIRVLISCPSWPLCFAAAACRILARLFSFRVKLCFYRCYLAAFCWWAFGLLALLLGFVALCAGGVGRELATLSPIDVLIRTCFCDNVVMPFRLVSSSVCPIFTLVPNVKLL